MKVGIDARIFNDKEYRGIATATYSIIKHLFDKDKDIEYYLISNGEIYLPFELPKQWKVHIEGRYTNGVLWTLFELKGIIKRLKLDVFWGPNFVLPRRVDGCRYIVTVHDLALFKFRGIASKSTYLVLKLLGKSSCRKADRILAVSESTQKDICCMYGIPKRKIVVCYNAIDREYLMNVTPTRPLDFHIEKNGFFVFLSTIEPRKNPVVVLQAYELYRSRGYGNEKLVFVGAGGWNLRRFNDTLKTHRYRSDILFTGYVSEAEKKWMISNSVALLFPSLYEGFGIPILEALSLGTLVITTRASSMPEVGGEACIYINNPRDKVELASGMFQITQITEEERIRLKEKMEEQIAKFSWAETANIILDVMKNV